MKLKGKVWKFGDDVNTDEIIAARYLVTTDPVEMGTHLMEDIRSEFTGELKPGDIIVAGENFGCGSSREHAPLAIKGSGISAVLAVSYARIFYRNAFNMGLPIFESEEAVRAINEGDDIEIDGDSGSIKNLTTGENYQAQPVPPFMQELIRAGGLINYLTASKS
ncbi:MAG: 3-isopropylmalate dehydratase small subunit [Candidatus Auribacterota bacterium]|nr:3-isopropylmalate dehydratase small subunit [Candidatus Auribacterota bacterium]